MLLPLVAVVAAAGFLVDDAFITARFAANVHREGRHAFNAGGAVVDGVTPLAMPWLLAPLASSVAASLIVQRVVGAMATVAGVAFLGARLVSIFGARAMLGLLVSCASFPLAVHASSGLETGLVTGLMAAAFAWLLDEATRARGALFLGLAAALRPELAPSVLVAVVPLLRLDNALHLLGPALVPPVVTMAARLAVFGAPFPLAVLAKPSDVRHGAMYVGAGLVVSGLGLAVPLVKVAWTTSPVTRSALALMLSHLAVVAFVGGDWMPYARLLAPAVPALALLVAAMPVRALYMLACAATLATEALFGWRHRDAAVHVAADRLAIVDALTPALAGAHAVAGLDVGYLGAAFAGPVVDLAGLTLPAVARLPGGHTSKQLPEGFLDAHEVDALVLWAPVGSRVELGRDALFGRVVETRLARSPSVARAFVEAARVPWDSRGTMLVIYTRRATTNGEEKNETP